MKLASPVTMIGPIGVETGFVVELVVVPALIVDTVMVPGAAAFTV